MPYFVKSSVNVPGFQIDPPIDPYNSADLPDAARHVEGGKLSDAMFSTGNRNIVSERFKTVVESLESGIHDFHPIQMLAKDGTQLELPYYMFNCGLGFCAVLSWKSGFDGEWSKTISGKPYQGLSAETTNTIYLSKPEISSRHIFCNMFHGPIEFVFSDELVKRLSGLNLKHLLFDRVEQIDEIWDAGSEIGPWLEWVHDHLDWIKENQSGTSEYTIKLYEYYAQRTSSKK